MLRWNRTAVLIIALAACMLGVRAASAQDTTANEGGDLLIAGNGAAPGQFVELRDITFDAKGVLYALDGAKLDSKTRQIEGNLRIQKFSREGKLLGVIDLRDQATGETLGEKNDPQRLAVDPAGNVYVTQPVAGRVQQFSPDGKFVRSFDIPRAMAVAVTKEGRVAVVPSRREAIPRKGWTWLDGDRIILLPSPGRDQQIIPLGMTLENVLDLATDREGSFYVKAEPNAILKFSAEGKLLKTFGGNPTRRTEDGSEVLHTVAVDSKGNVYTMSWGNPGLVTRFDADGQTVTQRGGQFKWANPWSVHSSYVPLAVDPDDRLWAACTVRPSANDVHRAARPVTPAIIRTKADYLQPASSAVRVTPVRTLGFRASLACPLPERISHEPGKAVPMELIIAPANRNVSAVAARWRAFDAFKNEISAGNIDLSLVNGQEARAAFSFTPPRFGAYLVIAQMTAPQGSVGGVGAHIGVTPHYAGLPELTPDRSKGGWADVPRQLFTGLPNMRIHPGKDDKALEKTDAEIAAATEAGITFLVQLVDNMKNLTPEHVRRVAERYKGKVKYYEVCNEPNFTSNVEEYFKGHKMAFEIIRQADPQAKVMGPATVNIDLNWLRRLYELGFKDVSDIVSIHDYEGHESITPEHWAWKYGELRRIMAAGGDAAKPVWQTERAIAGVRGRNFQGLVQAIRCTLHRDLLETFGVPSEHNNHYYLNQAGYSSVPTYVWSSDGPHPAALTLRTRHVLTSAAGRKYAGTIDFGPTGNTFLMGVRYAGPDGSQAIALRNLGSRPVPVECAAKGMDAVEVIDAFGNAGKRPVRDGRLALSLEQLPVYVVLAAGQELAAPRLDFGRNVAPLAKWEYSANVEKGEHALLTNGIFETYHNANPNGDTNGAKIWTGELPASADGQIAPQTLEAAFDAPQTIDKVVIRGVRADNTFCALLEYDLDCFDGQAWKTIEQVRRPMPASEEARTADATHAIWMDDTNLFIHQFAPTSAQRIRIVVRRTTNGFVPDARPRPIPAKFMLREVEIYAAPAK